MPVSVLMALMLYTGSKSLQYLPVPIFTIFKNISIIFVAYGESYIFGSNVTMMMLMSFILMILSSVMAAADNLSSNSMILSTTKVSTVGYYWIIFNCLSSAAFVLFMRYTLRNPANMNSTRQQFKDFDTVFYNNLLTAPIFLLFSVLGADGNSKEFWKYYSVTDNISERNHFFLSVLFSGISAFWISYASSW